MSKFKFSALVALVLVVVVPAALAQAQVRVLGTGTAVISDGASLGDTITYEMTGVTPPGTGFALEGWLVSDDGSVKLSTGVMAIGAEGEISHAYTSPGGDNLTHLYNKVLVTIEPVPDPDPAPNPVFAFSHEIPIGAMAHIRHLLTNWPPGEPKGILTNLQEQIQVAIVHTSLAMNSGTLDDVRLHTHHVINILEGEGGPNFEASFGNPGDGVGVFAHAQDRKHAGFAAGEAPGDPVINAHAELVDSAGKNAEDWAVAARDGSLTVLDQDSIDLAKILLNPVLGNLNAAMDGIAATGEDGAKVAYREGQFMATYTLDLGGLPAEPMVVELEEIGPCIMCPIVGDPTVPLLARVGLLAALVSLGAGALLVLRARRSRTRA